MRNKLKLLLALYGAFFKIGLFTFGGGYAMLPMLEKECVEKHEWTNRDELLDVFALAQCTPGIIAVNTATYIGKMRAGFFGAVFATLGVITPSVILISILSALLLNVADLPVLQHALRGVRVAVTALIFASVFKMAKNAFKDLWSVLLGAAAFLLVVLFGTSPVAIVVAAGLIGFLFFGGLRSRKEGDA